MDRGPAIFIVVLCVAIAGFVGYEFLVAKPPVASLPPGTPPPDAAILHPLVTPEDIAFGVASKGTQTLRVLEARRWLDGWVVAPGWLGTLQSIERLEALGPSPGAPTTPGVASEAPSEVLIVRVPGVLRQEPVIVHVQLAKAPGRTLAPGMAIRVGGRIASVEVIEAKGQRMPTPDAAESDLSGPASGAGPAPAGAPSRELRISLRDGSVLE